jgi:hypothetical protein
VVITHGHQSIKANHGHFSTVEREFPLQRANFVHKGVINVNCLREIQYNINITDVVDHPFEADNISKKTGRWKEDYLTSLRDPSATRNGRKER